ncbi:MAG: hypothetical protein N3F11_04365 [Casimicrobiaceae bacterium]|nr:hypothetical protein [Casimicrobiaceae bacterium]MDW8311287.1 hypothetical protein [Burkholderiales bacterium]
MLAGCATLGGGAPVAPLERNAGNFVTFSCDGNKSFQLRWNAETKTIRFRGHEGGFELTRAQDGTFRDDSGEYQLKLADGKGTELLQKGQAKYKGCAASS